MNDENDLMGLSDFLVDMSSVVTLTGCFGVSVMNDVKELQPLSIVLRLPHAVP